LLHLLLALVLKLLGTVLSLEALVLELLLLLRIVVVLKPLGSIREGILFIEIIEIIEIAGWSGITPWSVYSRLIHLRVPLCEVLIDVSTILVGTIIWAFVAVMITLAMMTWSVECRLLTVMKQCSRLVVVSIIISLVPISSVVLRAVSVHVHIAAVSARS
jgi:hypothetical protein